MSSNITEMTKKMDMEYVRQNWKEDGDKVLEAIARQNTKAMTGDEFMSHCNACGGNWGGMLLSGINRLYPEVYKAIPDHMGKNAFMVICSILNLLQIKFSEEE